MMADQDSDRVVVLMEVIVTPVGEDGGGKTACGKKKQLDETIKINHACRFKSWTRTFGDDGGLEQPPLRLALHDDCLEGDGAYTGRGRGDPRQ